MARQQDWFPVGGLASDRRQSKLALAALLSGIGAVALLALAWF